MPRRAGAVLTVRGPSSRIRRVRFSHPRGTRTVVSPCQARVKCGRLACIGEAGDGRGRRMIEVRNTINATWVRCLVALIAELFGTTIEDLYCLAENKAEEDKKYEDL